MIVLTGASGFIGRALAEELVRRGYKVLAVSRSGRAPEGAEALAWDLRRPLSVGGNVEAVIHLAASAAARRSYEEEWAFFENNVLTTLNAARLALEKGALFVLASSAEVYGVSPSPDVVYREGDCVCGRLPGSPYGVSKISAELAAMHYAVRGLRAVILRPTNTYGRLLFDKGEEARGYFVERALCGMLSGAAELVFDGFGESARQWLYYPDHVSAYIAVLGRADPRPVELYNVAGPEAASLKDVVSLLSSLTGWGGAVRWGARPRPVDPNFLLLDTSRLRSLGWRPVYGLRDGLADYVKRLGGRC
ncbi:MAG: NAD-dependent epimerase/dehydratase family protein [Thermoproteus sp.]